VQIALPIVTLVLGVVLGAWYTVYLRRPTLKITGGGSGGGPGPGHLRNHVRVINRPGLLGIRLGETILLGGRLHGHVEKGLTVDRNPANQCIANILDKESGRQVAPLMWRTSDANRPWQRIVTLNSGEEVDLMLFARLENEPSKYFVFEPADVSSEAAPRIPNEEAKFTDTREFLVRIMYSYGRQKLTFKATMRKGFDGRLSYETDGGGGSF
jgi:hypothetical protein